MSGKPIRMIPISRFTAACLAVLEEVRRTGLSAVITDSGEPIAEIHPARAAAAGDSWLGSMRGTATMADDLIEPALPPQT